jgi:hypothetical protein
MKTLYISILLVFITGPFVKAQWNSNGGHIYNTNSGYVGINVAAPNARLSIGGTLLVGGGFGNLDPQYAANEFSYLANTGQMLIGFNRTAGEGETDFINNKGGGNVGGFSFYEYGNDNSLKHLVRITGSGRLGIGTMYPNSRLEVNSENPGNGSDNWIAGNFGAVSGDRVVFGLLRGVASVGAHNSVLSAWSNLAINPEGGNVGIGTATPTDKLSVNGKIRAKEIKVENSNWPDYVFTAEYQLPSLKETEAFINNNKHLPGIPSQTEVAKSGIDLGDLNAKLLQKIEELTLHMIALEKQNEQQQKEINNLKSKK